MEMYELRRGGHVKRIERQVEPQREMIAVRHNDRDRRNVVRNGQSVNLNDRISLAANANPLDWKKKQKCYLYSTSICNHHIMYILIILLLCGTQVALPFWASL